MKFKFIVILLIAAFRLHSQGFAGPDIITCESTAVLGIPNPNPLHCYLWSGPGPINGINSPNPTIQTKYGNYYSVTVTDQNFSFKAIDLVYIEVLLGGLWMTPKYIIPDDTENQAKVTVIVNSLSVPVIWEITERTGAQGCEIDQDGNISSCTTSGRITVRATNANDFSCFSEEEFPVNNGVKEVIVRELPDIDRNASSLKSNPFNTLKVTKIHQVEVEAIPNDGEEFPEGQPDWGGTITPNTPHEHIWTIEESQFTPGLYDLILANTPAILLEYVDSLDVAPYNGPDAFYIYGFLEYFSDKIIGLGPFLNESPCTGNPVFDFSGLPYSVFRKWVEVNKDPRKGKYFKLEDRTEVNGPFFELEFQGGSNCTFLSRFGRDYSWPDIAGHAFLAPLLILGNSAQELTFDCNVIYDPSNPNYTTESSASGYTETTFSIDGSISYESRFGMVPSLTDGPFILETGDPAEPSFFNLSAQVDVAEPASVNYEYSWGGLQIAPTGRLYVGSPSNPVWTKKPKGTLNILDGQQGSFQHYLLPPDIFNFD